jgi:hypothetical protein
VDDRRQRKERRVEVRWGRRTQRKEASRKGKYSSCEGSKKIKGRQKEKDRGKDRKREKGRWFSKRVTLYKLKWLDK